MGATTRPTEPEDPVNDAAPPLLTTVEDGVAIITLNRPERLNSVTPALAEQYAAALRRFDDDADVRVVVVTGAGRAFCAGADLAELDRGVEHLVATFGSTAVAPETALRLRKPVVAAVNGPVAGLGFIYVLACDVRIVDPAATMQTSFAKLGLAAEYGISWLLPRVVGYSRATELLLSSRALGAEEAQRIGLAHAVSAPGESLSEALAYARSLVATGAPSSWAVAKAQLLTDAERGFDESLPETYEHMRAAFRGPDVAEALAARAAKRPPEFAALPPRPPLST